MAKKATTRKPRRTSKTKTAPRRRPLRILKRLCLAFAGAIVLSVGIYSVLPPPTTPYILSEGMRLGEIRRAWVSADTIAPEALQAVVAAEDANFCLHWGFDMEQLRAAIQEGADRGASTLTQQTVKNVWLWQGRSWPRKSLEALMTPVVEALWSKKRIDEVYI
ncbi:MAG: monofunctional biosynthetic peptidoglycan transglycosylase, partial [Boseongicola sp.]|nr:monofunctional biosynthetic peptidoglycan transglycosylase [Boseongicola sp.]